MKNNYRDTWTPLRIAFVYALFGVLWILFSDATLLTVTSDPEFLSILQTCKGWFFILITAMLLFWLMVCMIKQKEIILHELRESKEYNRLLFELSPVGLVLCRMDGVIVDLNDAYAKIIGRSVDKSLGLSFWDITPGKFAEQEKGTLVSLEETGRYGPYEKEYVHADGHSVPVRQNGRLIERNGDKFIWSSVEDISERKESEEKFFKIFRSSPCAIVLTSLADGKFVEVNESFLHLSGYCLDEVSGRSSLELNFWLNPDDRHNYLKQLQENGRVVSLETEFRRKSGETASGLISGEIIEVQGRPYLLSVILDITARKQVELELAKYRDHLEELVKVRTIALEESQHALLNMVDDLNQKTNELEEANARLRELDRLKSMFIASMSHELRTPLNSIIGFSGIMLQGLSGEINEEQRDQLGRIFRSGKHLLSLITDVIDIAKIESGKILPYAEEVDLYLLIDEAVEQVVQQAEGKGVVVKQEIPVGVMPLFTDRKRLLQCLLNFLSNAVKFTEAGTITVKADYPATAPGMVEISVRDTGIGIGLAEQKQLFAPFVRLDNTMRTTTPGTGLGLYLTKKLVTEVLAGEVGVESVPGEGSRFWLRVPVELKVE